MARFRRALANRREIALLCNLIGYAMSQNPVLLDIPDAIATERLILRSPMPGDGPAMNEAILDTWDALHPSMPWARERPTVDETEEIARRFRAHFITRTDLPMFMFLHDRPAVVGSTGLHRMDWSIPRFEIGYWIRRGYEGQGYVSEAVRGLTRFAFRTLRAQRVEIHCSHRNQRSQRVAERCGFLLDGRLRNHGREATGELRDMLVYSLVPEDPAVQALMAP
ncbi:MAG TPA: GNAT family N-acetyltransferase [Kofleriaceae bacterium]|jgi:RimJ/RimL family protein N-acetyltransferase|nr:GNAT family N-acetyltransferase [Kofleriaceae bacterium]